jgi:hypothetical protein
MYYKQRNTNDYELEIIDFKRQYYVTINSFNFSNSFNSYNSSNFY